MVIVKFKLKCVLKKLKTISSLSFSTTLHLYFLKPMTIRLSLSQEVKRILAFLRLHKNMQGAVVVAFFSFCFFLYFYKVFLVLRKAETAHVCLISPISC